jgi:hypothetical protein
MTASEIARQEGATPGAVSRALVRHQIQRRPPRRRLGPVAAPAVLRQLCLRERWSIYRLARHFNVAYATMRKRLLTADVPLRPSAAARSHGRRPPQATP